MIPLFDVFNGSGRGNSFYPKLLDKSNSRGKSVWNGKGSDAPTTLVDFEQGGIKASWAEINKLNITGVQEKAGRDSVI